MKTGYVLSFALTAGLGLACGAPPPETFDDSEITSDGNSDTNAISYAHVYADAHGLLFSNRATPNPPVTAPDGRQLTDDEWASFRRAKTKIRCDESGGATTIKIRARGLIPHGVYTVWHFLTDGTGNGALGAPDGSGNTFIADRYGRGNLDVTDELCDIGRLVFAYHLDNNTYGSSPGPAETWATHFVVAFTDEDATPARFAETIKTTDVSYAHVAEDQNGNLVSTRTSPPIPVTAPDGSPLSGDDWGITFARSRVRCKANYNRYRINARGLIPYGVYTVWHFLSDGSGAGALGAPDGSDNTLIADARGRASIDVSDEVCDIGRLVFAYHLDNKTWGDSPGPTDTWVTHFVADFQADN